MSFINRLCFALASVFFLVIAVSGLLKGEPYLDALAVSILCYISAVMPLHEFPKEK